MHQSENPSAERLLFCREPLRTTVYWFLAMSQRLTPLPRADTAVTAPASPVSRARAAAWAATLGLILAALYWGILRDLGRQWWDDANYSHGFIVPIFSGYLIWRERDRLLTLAPRGTAWGLLLLLGGIGALVAGDLGAENFLSRSSLIVILTGLVLFIVGA